MKTLYEMIYGPTAAVLLIVWGAVLFVLLIACANVANMQLARATERRREIAVRFALGASRWRVARLVIIECLLLTLAGGFCGILAASWTLDFLLTVEGHPMDPSEVVRMDPTVVLFCLLAAFLTALLCGVAPAYLSSHTNVVTALKEGAESPGNLQKARRSAWVVLEAGLALALLAGSAVIARSIVKLMEMDLGFDPANVLTMRISLPDTKYAEPARRIQFYDELLARVEALPGVTSAGIANLLPIQSCWTNGSYLIKGQAVPDPTYVTYIEHRIISPRFFETLRMPMRAGRQLEVRDGRTSVKAVVISERAALLFQTKEPPLGREIALGNVVPEGGWRTVVGVVRDVPCSGPHLPPRATMYEPYWQFPVENMSLVVRSTLPPGSAAAAVRRAVLDLDRDQPVYSVMTMEEILEEKSAALRFLAFVISAFTGIALLLAAAGVFGVLSFAVSRSTHEIGVRMAMGASRGQVQWLVVRRGLVQVASGLLLGIPMAVLGASLLRRFVYGVLPVDLLTLVAAVAALFAAGLAASLIPALRAARVEPMASLRFE
jgi:putative ABC transport system permease protein